MKLTFIKSSTVLIESENIKVICDPWITDGEYYGSWFHEGNGLQIIDEIILNVDYIYISHIHPDHFSRKSLNKYDKSIPILIGNYQAKFLKKNIENLGFNVIEIDHNQEFHLSEKLKIKIFHADNCDPLLCSKFFGCGINEVDFKSTQIDTMTVIYDENYSVLNVNDCPYELSTGTLGKIKEEFDVDFLLHGYCGAGPYPQCFEMSDEEMKSATEEKKIQFLKQGLNFINNVKPKYYMPFAGTYTLSGKNFSLNKNRGLATRQESFEYFKKHKVVPSEGIFLNTYESFDFDKNKITKSTNNGIEKISKSRIDELKNVKFDYERQEYPSQETIMSLIKESSKRFHLKRNELKVDLPTKVYIKISDENYYCKLHANCEEIEFVDKINLNEEYIILKTDLRLLENILKGPRYGHWNNAEIGSHLRYKRSPNIFRREIFHCLNFLHS